MEGGKPSVFGVILLAIVGVSALVLGVLQSGKNIKKPFEPDPAVVARMKAGLVPQAVDKTKDTDGDGLTDYEEAEVHRTSPYIKDTDSDGVTDGAEAKAGTDPLCPAGKDCYGTAGKNAPANAASGADAEENLNIDLGGAFTSELNGFLDQSAVYQLAPADIRQMLKEQGVSEEILGSFDDQTLLELYNQAFAEAANANVSP